MQPWAWTLSEVRSQQQTLSQGCECERLLGKQTLESVPEKGMQQGWENGGVDLDCSGTSGACEVQIPAQQVWGSLNSSSLANSQIKQMLAVHGPHGKTCF